jgi:nicotinamidase-related amidase
MSGQAENNLVVETMINMPNTNAFYERVTPENAMVMFIDLQTGLLPGVKTIDPVLLRNNIVALAKIAILYDLPVVLTTCGSNGPNGPLMEELAVMFPDRPAIDRTLINAWDDPRVTDVIRSSGRRKLIMCGISTDVSLALPAISATASGYTAYALLDVSGTWSDLIERGAIARLAQAGVIPTNWTAVTAELQTDLSLAKAQGTARVLREQLGSYYYPVDRYLARGAESQRPAESQR